MQGIVRGTRRAAGIAVVGALLLTGNAWAHEEPVAAAAECVGHEIVNPFAEFGDLRDYALVPGGTFDDSSAAGWSLEGGASAGDSSLGLPEGASATTPAFCVDLNWPTMRFMARQSGEKKEKLDVEVLYSSADGKHAEWRKVETVKARAEDGWHLTDDVKLKPERGNKLPGGRPLALRFTSQGAWQIDDVYVDPRNR